MGKNKTKIICDKIIKRYEPYRLNYIPFGDFCYEDIKGYVRYYCPYLKGCNSCRLVESNDFIFDFIKICNKSRG